MVLSSELDFHELTFHNAFEKSWFFPFKSSTTFLLWRNQIWVRKKLILLIDFALWLLMDFWNIFVLNYLLINNLLMHVFLKVHFYLMKILEINSLFYFTIFNTFVCASGSFVVVWWMGHYLMLLWLFYQMLCIKHLFFNNTLFYMHM